METIEESTVNSHINISIIVLNKNKRYYMQIILDDKRMLTKLIASGCRLQHILLDVMYVCTYW